MPKEARTSRARKQKQPSVQKPSSCGKTSAGTSTRAAISASATKDVAPTEESKINTNDGHSTDTCMVDLSVNEQLHLMQLVSNNEACRVHTEGEVKEEISGTCESFIPTSSHELWVANARGPALSTMPNINFKDASDGIAAIDLSPDRSNLMRLEPPPQSLGASFKEIRDSKVPKDLFPAFDKRFENAPSPLTCNEVSLIDSANSISASDFRLDMFPERSKSSTSNIPNETISRQETLAISPPKEHAVNSTVQPTSPTLGASNEGCIDIEIQQHPTPLAQELEKEPRPKEITPIHQPDTRESSMVTTAPTISMDKAIQDLIEMPPPPPRPKKHRAQKVPDTPRFNPLNTPKEELKQLEEEIEKKLEDLIITAQIAQNLQKKIECEAKEAALQHKKLREDIGMKSEQLLFEVLLQPTIQEMVEMQAQAIDELDHFIDEKVEYVNKQLNDVIHTTK